MLMTASNATKFTSQFLGYNKDNLKAPIGVISYNTVTGQVRQCEVFATFWGNKSTPDTLDSYAHLVKKGYGLIRMNTVKYSSLV